MYYLIAFALGYFLFRQIGSGFSVGGWRVMVEKNQSFKHGDNIKSCNDIGREAGSAKYTASIGKSSNA